MKAAPLTPDRRDALAALLDDAAPPVRRALLEEFRQLGEAARQYLLELAHGRNRVLATHAAWYIAELKFADPVNEFREFIRSLSYELETGALLLSRTVNPDVQPGPVCEQLDALAQRCRELLIEPASLREKCRVLNRVLFHEHGFHGNREHYGDPQNSFLDRVLARRKGLPITLSIVYLLVAQRCGIDLEPVGLPGHFIVGCYGDDAPFFIDPFESGRLRSAEEILAWLRANNHVPSLADLAPVPVREVLHRCCRNLAQHYAAAGDEAHARLFAQFSEEFDATFIRESSP